MGLGSYIIEFERDFESRLFIINITAFEQNNILLFWHKTEITFESYFSGWFLTALNVIYESSSMLDFVLNFFSGLYSYIKISFMVRC